MTFELSPRISIRRSCAQEHVTKGIGTWAEGTCEPEQFLVNGDKVVVYLHAWVHLKDSAEWIGGRFADGLLFRNGKIIQNLSFAERADAFQRAWWQIWWQIWGFEGTRGDTSGFLNSNLPILFKASPSLNPSLSAKLMTRPA